MTDQVPIQSVERVKPGQLHIDGSVVPPDLPIDYNERWAALCLKADFTDTVFAHIANGGTLITLASAWGVRHSDITNFISSRRDLNERYQAALFARNEWEVERCLQELRDIATVDIRQAYKPDGSLKDIKDIPSNVAAAISSIDSDELFAGSGAERVHIGYTKRVKFWDKGKAIEAFMKKHGLLVDRLKVHTVTRLEDLIGPANADVVDAEIVTEPKKVDEIPKAGGDTRGLET